MKGYISIDEALTIIEHKIKGSMYEIIGATKFFQNALDRADILPVYRFKGYIVVQCRVDTDFWKENDNIQNIWFVDGYFRDDHNLYVDNPSNFITEFHLKSAFRDLDNIWFELKFNTGHIKHIISKEFLGNYDAELINRVDSEGKVYLTNWHATMFNEKPIYEGTFGYDGLRDTITINKNDVYISINELRDILKFDASAYELSARSLLNDEYTVENKIKSTNNIEHLNSTIEKLETEIKELQSQLDNALKKVETQGYLDPNNKHFCIEMKLCHDTWNHLYSDVKPYGKRTNLIKDFLNNYEDIDVTQNAIKRISTVIKPKEQPATTKYKDDI